MGWAGYASEWRKRQGLVRRQAGEQECQGTFYRVKLSRARQSGAATRQNQKPGQVPLGVRIPPSHVAETGTKSAGFTMPCAAARDGVNKEMEGGK